MRSDSYATADVTWDGSLSIESDRDTGPEKPYS